ncbi:MAG: hypothetical protein JW896_13265 [Deltaproteobacteria bacterium]|nr:hypothetical protein [Deltaproteobacteria bacterium]
MDSSKSLRALAVIFFVSGLYDAFGGFYFAFTVGTGRSVDSPSTDPFYALFIATFLFSFAYLQLFSAFNIRRYLLNVGVVIFGRLFYVVLSFSYLLLVPDFPRTFMPTAVVDLCWSVAYVVFAIISSDVRLKDLFISARGKGVLLTS